MFSPLLWMCLPMFKATDGTSITLINVIMGIINGSMPFDKILGDKSYLFPVLTMVCIILFSLVVIISSLFSMGKKAFKRNLIFSIINLLVFIVCGALSATKGCDIGAGLYIVTVVYIQTIIFHYTINKKLNK